MKIRATALTTLVIALLAYAAPSARAQGHTIRGKVRSSSGVNLPQITISLESGNGGLINQTVTNNEGDFSFGGLGESSYILTVSAPEYNPVSERVEFVRHISSQDPGETRTVEISLVRKTSRSPRAGLLFVQNVPKPARDAFEQATKLIENGRAQEAQTALESAIRTFPDYCDAHFVLAGELAKQGKLDEAIKHLNEAQRVNPKDDRIWYAFGKALMQQHKYSVAARVFAEAANLNPLEPQYPLMQGTALIDQADEIDATTREATDARAYFFTEAEKVLLKAYERSDKKLTAVHLQLARLYEKRGDRSRAAGELEEYLRKTPDARNADAIRDAIKKLRSRQ
jgi:tetratricopeptide (TPR) repeat protein